VPFHASDGKAPTVTPLLVVNATLSENCENPGLELTVMSRSGGTDGDGMYFVPPTVKLTLATSPELVVY
jgi:hypothetical protein